MFCARHWQPSLLHCNVTHADEVHSRVTRVDDSHLHVLHKAWHDDADLGPSLNKTTRETCVRYSDLVTLRS